MTASKKAQSAAATATISKSAIPAAAEPRKASPLVKPAPEPQPAAMAAASPTATSSSGGMKFLTPEQRAELHRVAIRACNHMLPVSNACGPLNIDWIKAVVLEVGKKLVDRFGADEPADVVPFLLNLQFPKAAFASPRVLEAALTARLNAIHETDPAILETVVFAGMTATNGQHGYERDELVNIYFDYAASEFATYTHEQNNVNTLL